MLHIGMLIYIRDTYVTMAEWETIRIPSGLSEKVDKFLETKFADEWGYTSKSQVIVSAVRNFLQQNRKLVFYLKSPKFGQKLKFKKNGPLIFCVEHNSQVCIHTAELFRHKKLFDFDLLDDGDILAGVDFDKKPDIKNPQPI